MQKITSSLQWRERERATRNVLENSSALFSGKMLRGVTHSTTPPPSALPLSIPYQLHSSKDFRLLVVVSKEHLINFDEKSVKKDFSNTTAKHKHVLQVHPNQLIILVKLATLYIIVQLCFSMV